MAKWTGYFKIVSPESTAMVQVTDSQTIDGSTYGNYTWFQRLVQGQGARLARYGEYDVMDRDVEVTRALDIIAEEMTGNNTKTGLPLNIVFQAEEKEKISETVVLTLRAAVRHWSEIHNWHNRLFHIARATIKYGDVFFKKSNEFSQWQHVPAKSIVGAIVDQDDVTKIYGWIARSEILKPTSVEHGGYTSSQTQQTQSIPSKDIVRFTLNDDMSDTAPFGESILLPVHRAHKQKELLEDAIIIYRIQRAPERRVFYIDVGKMPPHRTKQYLEQVKNEIRQKKIPVFVGAGGKDTIDSVYNPQSMCLALDTKIPLLDGRVLTLQQMIDEYDSGKENWVYSANPETGNIVPGLVSWAGVTRKDAETVKLTLDNGDIVVCTPDHKFPVQGKGKVQAKDLVETDSLWPFHLKHERIRKDSVTNDGQYAQIYNPSSKRWEFVHRLVAHYMKDNGQYNEWTYRYKSKQKRTIHHKNFNSLDNRGDNLVFMSGKDHSAYHLSLCNNQMAVFSDEMQDRFHELAQQNIMIKFVDLMTLLNNDKVFMNAYAKNNVKQQAKFKLKTDRFLQKMFLRFIKVVGYKNWKEYQQYQIQQQIDIKNVLQITYDEQDIRLLQCVLNLIRNQGIHNFKLVNYLKIHRSEWDQFCELYEPIFTSGPALSIPHSTIFERLSKHFGYGSFKHMVNQSANFNHRVIKAEQGPVIDTGTLTIDGSHKFHNYHNFAIQTSCKNNQLDGILTANSEDFFFSVRSEGRGSRVETLPGGQNLGQLEDLDYFMDKVFRGLRVPTSYMKSSSDNAIFNDGRVGTAYIEELRFALFVARLQGRLEVSLDTEFKTYLRAVGINIDPTLYVIRLPEPSNFGKYRQQELDSALLNAYTQADGIPHISKRFGLSRFLQLTRDEIATNEGLLREEKGIKQGEQDMVQRLYNPEYATEAAAGALGGLGPELGGGELPPTPVEGEPGLEGEVPGIPEGGEGAPPAAAGGASPPLGPPPA